MADWKFYFRDLALEVDPTPESENVFFPATNLINQQPQSLWKPDSGTLGTLDFVWDFGSAISVGGFGMVNHTFDGNYVYLSHSSNGDVWTGVATEQAPSDAADFLFVNASDYGSYRYWRIEIAAVVATDSCGGMCLVSVDNAIATIDDGGVSLTAGIPIDLNHKITDLVTPGNSIYRQRWGEPYERTTLDMDTIPFTNAGDPGTEFWTNYRTYGHQALWMTRDDFDSDAGTPVYYGLLDTSIRRGITRAKGRSNLRVTFTQLAY